MHYSFYNQFKQHKDGIKHAICTGIGWIADQGSGILVYQSAPAVQQAPTKFQQHTIISVY